MLTRFPKSYTVLIAGTGKAPITLAIKPVPVLIAALVIVGIPAGVISYLTHHSTRLAQENRELTDTANAVLTELNTLDSEIETLKERAGLSETEAGGSDTEFREDSQDRSSRINLDQAIKQAQELDSPGSTSANASQGGPALPVKAASLFKAAQQRMPTLALALEADVKPALEETLAKEADREAAFPSGWPLQGKAEISSEFGLRRNPFGGSRYEMHQGLDFRGPIGRPVYATAEGQVMVASAGNGYGKHIVINHDYGYETLYAHLSDFNVEAGDKVRRGDLIGFLGNTGRSSGPHLHYGVYRDGQPVNPRYYLKIEDSQL
ncbi:MAG: M23 family metallopeptidase [Cyanobacteria bacterium Co-bin13]|nr:M23 family metallopeptidase [Cyanobacteria bacterium Co-bin13]